MHFITDVFSYARDGEVADLQSQLGLEPLIVEAAIQLGDTLDALSEAMKKLQEENPDLNCSNFLLIINSCREVLPRIEAPAPVAKVEPNKADRRRAKLKMNWDTGD